MLKDEQVSAIRKRKDGSEIRAKVQGDRWWASNGDLFTTLRKVVNFTQKKRQLERLKTIKCK